MCVVAIDVDGVLADFTWGWTGLGKAMHDKEQRHDHEQKTWEYDKEYTKKQQDGMWDIVKATHDWWCGLRPTRELYDIDEDLLCDVLTHARVYFVTARPESTPSIQQQTARWLEAHLPIQDDYVPSVIIVERPEDKAGLFGWLGVEYAIDDKGETVEELANMDYMKGVYLLARPYNEDVKKGKRVTNLNAFLAAIPIEENEHEESLDRE